MVLWSVVPFFFPNLVLQYHKAYFLFVFIGVFLVVIALSVIDYYTIQSSEKKRKRSCLMPGNLLLNLLKT